MRLERLLKILSMIMILLSMISCGNSEKYIYTVGGNVSGLSGSLVIQINNSDDLSLNNNGSFNFSKALTDGTNYSVTIKTMPPHQKCSVSSGDGVLNGSDVTNVNINCIDYFYFIGTPNFEWELWKTDGTGEGTVRVKDVSYVEDLTMVNGTLFFSACAGLTGLCESAGLWKSDGTAEGTVMVKETSHGGPALVSFLTDVNGVLFFNAYDWAHDDYELWKSDGTADGTVMVKDINISDDSYPAQLTNLNGKLLFTANDGVHGWELWRSDGTESGTVLVKDINPAADSTPWHFTVVSNTLFFNANDGVHGKELWKTDGTEQGTVMVKDINSNGDSFPHNIANVNGTLFFAADDGIHGTELWKSDGTEQGTVIVKDINTTESSFSSSFPYELTDVNGTLFFTVYKDVQGYELWSSDGTESGTQRVKDLYPGEAYSVGDLINVDGVLYFWARKVTSLYAQLWKSDGTEAGTIVVSDLANPKYGTGFGITKKDSVNGMLYFSFGLGTSGSSVVQLWKSDGTEEGTGLIKRFAP